NRTNERRPPDAELRHPVSGAPEARAGRRDRVGLGRVGEQSQGQVLPADGGRTARDRSGDPRLGRHDGDSRALPRAEDPMKPRAWIARVGGWWRGRRAGADDEIRLEFESHLQMRIDDLVASGTSPSEARRLALIEAGSLNAAAEAYGDRRGLP